MNKDYRVDYIEALLEFRSLSQKDIKDGKVDDKLLDDIHEKLVQAAEHLPMSEIQDIEETLSATLQKEIADSLAPL